MAVDINDEVRMWGGFSFKDFWLGLAVLGVGFVAIVMVGSFILGPALAFLSYGLLGSAFAMFWVYQRDLPKGYLKRRWRQEGRFLFIRVPWVKGTELLAPPANFRRRHFTQAWEELNASGD